MPRRPTCRYTLDDAACGKTGAHLCRPRAGRAVQFFEEVLCHTKGRWARQPFLLARWQRDDVIVPLFGRVRWEPEVGLYVRQHTLGWIELARKNGKSELDAGVALLLTCADDEEGAEVYGCAVDREQARKVYDVAERMVHLSPLLSRRLTVRSHAKRIVDERTGSYYEVVASDASGNLGHNPHGVIFDEVLTQKSPDLWNALRTGMGTRTQPLMLATTTAGDDPASFAATQHAEMARVAAEPKRAPHIFTFIRNTPPEADPFDEGNWAHANPALGDFLSITALREEALEARNDPAKENSFRQFRLCQWVQQATRWMPLHVWDQPGNVQLLDHDALVGRRCFGGLDLAATTDLAALAWAFPDPDGGITVRWRFWTPEALVPHLDRYLGGRASVWARAGLLTATPGDVIDYERIHADIDADATRYDVTEVGYDPWGAEQTRQWIEARGLTVFPVRQTFQGLSGAMKELMRLAQMARLRHGGDPVARWNADSIEVRQDDNENIRPVKPERKKSGKRIDGMVALALALAAWLRYQEEARSVYETRGLTVV